MASGWHGFRCRPELCLPGRIGRFNPVEWAGQMYSIRRCEIWQPAGARCAIGNDLGDLGDLGDIGPSGPADPAIANDTEPRVDRGLIGRAIGIWDDARLGAGMPTTENLRRRGLGDLQPHHAMLDTAPGRSEVVVTSADRWFAGFCGGDPVGKWLSDCLPEGVWEEWWHVLAAVAEARKPLPCSNRSILDRGRLVRYDAVFLPISSDGVLTERVLAVLQYRRTHL